MPGAGRLGDRSQVPADAHGCPACPHPAIGPGISGSPTVNINGRPALRVEDPGIHAACCGPNTWTAITGSATVIINGKPAHRMNDMDLHCGGIGKLIEGSSDVIFGGPPTTTAAALFLVITFVIEQLAEALKSPSPPPGTLTPAQAQALFDEEKARKDIAFDYPDDGCYARAHLMMKDMQAKGIDVNKVWTFAGNGDSLYVDTPNNPAGRVDWGYHVAPTVPVQQSDGSIQPMVIDPSITDHPVTIDEWKNAQHDTPTVVQTKPGESPTGVGSGYWPGKDPNGGNLDEAAEETMDDYKRAAEARRRAGLIP